MIWVSKKNGIVYEKMDKEILSFHARDLKSALALVEETRELRYENEEFIDDLSEAELQAAKNELKSYCLANKLMPLYFEYLLATEDENARLNILKEQKKNEIQNKRDAALDGGVLFKNHRFQTREKDRINIAGATLNLVLDMQNGTKNPKLSWIDINDEKVNFNAQEFLQFGAAVVLHSQKIAFRANEFKKQIEQASSQSELDLIVWEEGQ